MTTEYSPENPLGIQAIDHLEITCHDWRGPLKDLLIRMGFAKTFEKSAEKTALYSQGQVRFLLTANPDKTSASAKYLAKHDEGVSKISFLVDNVQEAIREAEKRGATVLQDMHMEETEAGVFLTAQIQGFGDVVNEFVERPNSAFRPEFKKIENDSEAKPLRRRVARIDHLTNNVPKGEMEKWVEFYERVYGFKVTRYFDIKGVKTGLESKVVQLPNGAIIIPINEPEQEGGKSQIQEFLDRHNGPGVQHIALTTADIIETISELRERDMKFLKIPHTYYEDIPKRNLGVTEDLGILEENQILVDGDKDGYLLQIFSDTYIGPLFFEYIQRKNHNGFGEGNFQALFDAIERDQQERGYLD